LSVISANEFQATFGASTKACSPSRLFNNIANSGSVVLARKVGTGMPMNKTFSSYWRTNIYETTSGNFATDLLNFHTSQIGADHILYSVDYPFVMMDQGQAWVETLEMSPFEKDMFIRGNAIQLLGLDN
jgi:2,3-dihydroxybenzoate decarboxylase